MNARARLASDLPDGVVIAPLDDGPGPLREAAAAILLASFDDPERYGPARIQSQLDSAPLPYYRRFFIARRDDEVLGVGGIKAADWASDTHLLYLSAVAEHARGQGIARALVMTRVAWVMETFEHGRVLVSTPRPRRFARFGFRAAGRLESAGRRLMLLEF